MKIWADICQICSVAPQDTETVLLVGVTGLELKDLIIAIYRTFRKSPILRTLR